MKFLADENFNNDIIRGLKRLNPEITIIRTQDTQMYQADDASLLEWASQEGFLLLSHDVKTMVHFAYERIKQNLPVLGLIIVPLAMPIGQAIDDILIIYTASSDDDLRQQVTFLPL